MAATVTPTPRENPIENPREKPKNTPSNQAEAIRAMYLRKIKAMRSAAMTSQCMPKNVTKLSICVKFQCTKSQWVWVLMCKVTMSLRVNVPSYNEFICPCAQKISKYRSLLVIHLLNEAGEKIQKFGQKFDVTITEKIGGVTRAPVVRLFILPGSCFRFQRPLGFGSSSKFAGKNIP